MLHVTSEGMSHKRVLIVEDNWDNRSIYREILVHAGYDVVEAENGEVGVRRARDLSPDLILMDISMPVMDGWQAIARLKADPVTSSIPVCALSAHVLWAHENSTRVTEAGFACYLLKPIDPKDVLAVVRERIGPAAVT